ncbi:G-type lectin S-receptor-like serine/threonine-protein kinase At1g11410 isoform X2 [Olea europaea var. sylvestris]|uniref:G-type lectin S-receptor-like serine/threonine-protein kinase At1g11410 isoform X2 n=1 Tax=Olea europaea var. sylvestris TaxID=158386 RepID=UPI000C1D6FF6|nr:G-type lectin S-receptor-like serine/threonine-protein kinase At1g11410 isoform X2 [Olea europaea var. sylvestris]
MTGRKKIWIIIAVVITVVLLLLGSSWFIMRKIKQGKLEEELEKMITLEEYTDTDELENNERKGHDLKLFTYSSILAATNSFSSENKLGEGGFGPVYKNQVPLTWRATIPELCRLIT